MINYMIGDSVMEMLENENDEIEILELNDDKKEKVIEQKEEKDSIKEEIKKTKKELKKEKKEEKKKQKVEKKQEKKERKAKKKEAKNIEKASGKRKMRTGEKVFFFINLLIILGILGFYTYRTVYYYKISHDVNTDITLKDKILSFGKVIYKDDGLYEKNGNYYFKGEDVDNYVFYSGRMFRIIEINNGIKAIEDETLTSLVWTVDSSYEESIIYSWLKDHYINTLKDYEVYLKESNWCNESIDIENYECEETIKDYAGLLSTEEYLRAGGKNSYLNNGTFFWTGNQDDDHKALYVNNEGSINNMNAKEDNYFSYGIRGVITFKEDLLLVKGEGTKDDPYIIEDEPGVLIRDKAVGSYVNYNGETFRILNVDEDGVQLILDGVLEEKRGYYDTFNYLNGEYLNKFNTEELVKINYGSSDYNLNSKYNINTDKSSSNYVIIPSIGDLFINEYGDYWLTNVQDYGKSLFYTIDDNAMFFADLSNNSHGIRPIIKVSSKLIVEDGNGMKENPYILGEEKDALGDESAQGEEHVEED